MALPTYQLGTVPSVAEFNAFLRPNFDQDPPAELFPGHLYRLTDDALSNTTGSIKPDYRGFANALLVTAGIGLSIAYAAGTVIVPGGAPTAIAAGNLPLPDNSTNWIYVTTTGSIATSTTKPSLGLIIAQVITLNAAVSTVTDWRNRAFHVVPGLIDPARLGTATPSSTTFLRGDQSWAQLTIGVLPSTEILTTTAAMSANNSYTANNVALVQLTLPPTAAYGSTIQVEGKGTGGWKILQNSGQIIYFGNAATTLSTGSIASTNQRDVLTLKCVTANTDWQVTNSIGILNLV